MEPLESKEKWIKTIPTTLALNQRKLLLNIM